MKRSLRALSLASPFLCLSSDVLSRGSVRLVEGPSAIGERTLASTPGAEFAIHAVPAEERAEFERSLRVPPVKAGVIGRWSREPREPSALDSSVDPQAHGEDGGSHEPFVLGDHTPPRHEDVRNATGILAYVYWLGHFHPPLVHLPIGVLIAAAIAEFLNWRRSKPLYDAAARFCVIVGALGAVLAGVLGWLLAGFHLTDGHWWLTSHRWFGSVSVLWALLLLVLSERSRGKGATRPRRRAYRVALLIGTLLVLVAGTFGGAMIYGFDAYALPS